MNVVADLRYIPSPQGPGYLDIPCLTPPRAHTTKYDKTLVKR